MAEEEAKSSGGGYTDVFFWILLALVVWSVIKYVISMFGISAPNASSVSSAFTSFFNIFQIISVFLCLVFFLGTIYARFKLGQLLHHAHHAHSHDHGHAHHSHGDHGSHASKPQVAHQPNKRWTNILSRMSSANEADWRLAIIECDILLNEMLQKMGYHGDTIADKMKLVERSDFHTIDEAWDAHKTRNRIAHSGSEYHLSRSEAEQTFEKYKKVFDEFYFI